MKTFLRSDRVLFYINRLLVTGMMVCLAVTLVQFGQWIFPEWRGTYLVPVLFLVSVESLFTHQREQRLTMFSPEWFSYRITEWVLLLILLKFSTYIAHGLNQLWIDLPLWQKSFGQYFFTGEYVIIILLAFMIWSSSAIFSEELAELEGDEGSIRSYDLRGFPIGRARLRQRLSDHILFLGAGMIFLTVLVNIDWKNILPFSSPPRVGLSNLFFYFLFSLVMLSLTQFSILKAGWLKEKIPFSQEIILRWSAYTFLLILFLALIASLLPTSYSVGLLGILNYLISLALLLFQVIWFILSLPIILVWALLSLLFKSNIPVQPKPPVPVMPNLPPPSPGASTPWLELLKSLIFWVIFVGVIIYSLRYYLQEHPELVEWLRKWRGVRWLQTLWKSLFAWMGGLNRELSGSIRARIQNRRAGNIVPESRKRGWINLRRLAPRQQVIFYYGALLRRGGERGLPRHPSQTPFEYSYKLKTEINGLEENQDVTQDIASLTDQFIEARYSRHEVTREHAGLARRYWERIRRVLHKPNPS